MGGWCPGVVFFESPILVTTTRPSQVASSRAGPSEERTDQSGVDVEPGSASRIRVDLGG